jgi:N utilization substance protein B
MARRRGARKIALETLYEHDVSGRPAAEILDRYRADPSFAYAAVLVNGVEDHAAEVDELITRYAEDWTVSRMPPIDRNLLRVGVVEMLYLDVPPAVTINEAVDLAKLYSTADSGRFVNGILGRIAREATRSEV